MPTHRSSKRKLTFSTLGCPSYSLQELLACAKNNGYDTLEIRLDRENRMLGYSLDNASEAKALLDANEIKVLDLGTGLTFRGECGENRAEIEHCARLARAVGARALRVFAGAHVASPEKMPLELTRRIGVELAACADIAARYGISLWLETHSAYSTGKSVGALMSCVNLENVGVIWDIMHSIEFGESPDETVRCLKNKIVHVHLKDGVPPTSGEDVYYRLTALDKGAVDFGEIARALKSISYEGYLSLEWELMWHPELSACYADTDALLLAYRTLIEKYF